MLRNNRTASHKRNMLPGNSKVPPYRRVTLVPEALAGCNKHHSNIPQVLSATVVIPS
ncbi:hypothetical protein ACU8KH_02274 [Lachancea thermotolerans]